MKNERKKLISGCSRTGVFISPRKYQTFTSKSNFPKQWFVQCRFFDPDHIEQYPDGFQYRVKFSGDNLQELKLTAEVYKQEMELNLDSKNYNPISRTYMSERKGLLHPYMPFIKALEKANENLSPSWSKDHAYEVSRCVKHVNEIKDKLHYSNLLINEIRTFHIKTILDELDLTDSVFNKSRSYLQSLFKELTQYGCCENNPVDNITKRAEILYIREIISEDKLQYVYRHLKTKCYSFFRYGKIFFYSGGRSSEFMQLQKKHVDIANQEYQILIKKGKRKTWVKKVIIPAAVPYWKEILDLCESQDDFLFSKGLLPGSNAISPKQISRRWKRHVKDSEEIKDNNGKVIKVTEDFYTLKHLFLDILDEMHTAPIIPISGPAQRMAGHTTESTTDIYTKGKTARKNNDLKRLMIS